MSILIKGMEMPKNCGECLTNYMLNVVCDCDLNNIEDGMRLPNCPLIELTPHGRLIDADALKFDEALETCSIRVDGINRHIDSAPTVIESEE